MDFISVKGFVQAKVFYFVILRKTAALFYPRPPSVIDNKLNKQQNRRDNTTAHPNPKNTCRQISSLRVLDIWL